MAALIAGLYSWTADFPMVFDDDFYLKENPLFPKTEIAPHLADFREFASRPQRMGLDPDRSTNIIMRPLAYATFTANHALDGFNPRWFRAVNIAVHFANSALIYCLVLSIFKRSGSAASLPLASRRFISVAAALLFAAHPLATESVTYIIQRFTSLSATFYLLALVLHITAGGIGRTAARRAVRAASVLAALLGMQTKECVFTLPLMAVLVDRLAVGTALRLAIRRAVPLLLCMPLVPALVILTSWAQSDGNWSLARTMNLTNSLENPISQWHYLTTQLTVVTDYLRQIVWASEMNVDPQWPVHRSLLAWPVFSSLAVIVAVIAAAAWFWRRWPADARTGMAAVFTAWFFITVATSSSLVPLPDMKAEHRCYLPSAGIFIAIACLLDWLITRRAALLRPVGIAFLSAVVSALSLATCMRNEVWRTNITLWEDAVAKSPDKARPRSNLGVSYAEAGRMDEAEAAIRKAAELDPEFLNARMNLAILLTKQHRWREVLDALAPAAKTRPLFASDARVGYMAGLSLVNLGRFKEAADVLDPLARQQPDDHMTRLMLGYSYAKIGDTENGRLHLRHAARLKPDDPATIAAISQSLGGGSDAAVLSP